MTKYITVVLFVKALVAPVGVAITYLAYRAYRHTEDISLRSFAVGFGAITVGTVLGGGLDHIFGVKIGVGLLLHSLLTALGFLVLAHSVYLQDTSTEAEEASLITISK